METRHDIEEKRASMTEKLEMLEERVRETVESAKSTVEDIMENVKETVDETVGTVKETVGDARSTVEGIVENVKDTMDDTVTMVKQSFDFNYQMDQHPWLMLSGSVLIGYLVGSLGRNGSAGSRYPTRGSWTGAEARRSGYFATASSPEVENPPVVAAVETRRSSIWDGALGQFKDEFDTIKGAVIGALMSNLRDMVKESLPNLAPQLEKAINSAATKLGAEPVTEGDQDTPHNGQHDQGRHEGQSRFSQPSGGPAGEHWNRSTTV
jgi:ElaB/YqjD/DUF883 family membrane-anchored ribosome-binding protein